VIHALGARGDTVGTGTGFVVGDDGLFVTNYHVVQVADSLAVETLEGKRFAEVGLVAADPEHDLALLRVEKAALTPLRLGSDAEAAVGDPVFVMGNPMGMYGTFSDGMVSGKRPVEGVSMLQISAPISPGSSGGPVMNDRGEVIGVATLILMGGQNLNLAVPVRYLRPLLAERRAAQPFAAALLPREAERGLAVLDGRRHPGAPPARRSGENVDDREVRVQFDALRGWAAERGYEPAVPVHTGALGRGQASAWELELEAGREYLITARCDNDCSDVDIGLFDGRGTSMGADTGGDDYPLVLFRPAEAGTFRVVTIIAQCRAEPCTYGVAVYRK
jgi:S1-C subfamily serine protease